jgi:hypothetical protein
MSSIDSISGSNPQMIGQSDSDASPAISTPDISENKSSFNADSVGVDYASDLNGGGGNDIACAGDGSGESAIVCAGDGSG